MARPLFIDYEKHYSTKKDGDVIILEDLGRPPEGGNRNVRIKFLDTGNEQVSQLANVKNANVRDQAKYDITGKIYHTHSSGDIKIIQKLGIMGGTNTMYEVEFLDTGNRVNAAVSAIERGLVRDPLGGPIGEQFYTGNIAYPKDYRLYDKWVAMIQRTNNRDGKHPKYANVSMCDRWNYFGNFVMDAMQLPGCDKVGFIKNCALDKDLFQLCLPKNHPRIYSPNTCCFLKTSDNIFCSYVHRHYFIADEHGIYVLNGVYYVRPYWFGQTWNFGAFSTIEAAITAYNNRCAMSNLPQEYYIKTNINCDNLSRYRVSPNLLTETNKDIHAPFREYKFD